MELHFSSQIKKLADLISSNSLDDKWPEISEALVQLVGNDRVWKNLTRVAHEQLSVLGNETPSNPPTDVSIELPSDENSTLDVLLHSFGVTRYSTDDLRKKFAQDSSLKRSLVEIVQYYVVRYGRRITLSLSSPESETTVVVEGSLFLRNISIGRDFVTVDLQMKWNNNVLPQ